MAIPRIETDRLILRGHETRDFELCAKMWADPVTTRYTIGEPSNAHRTWMRMLSYRGLWELTGFGYFAVEEKASGLYVGDVGFADYKRALDPPVPAIQGLPEIGWALAAHAHGRGYATEALRAVVTWGDRELSSPRTACLISGENTASLRVAEKLGYREIGKTSNGGLPGLVFTRG